MCVVSPGRLLVLSNALINSRLRMSILEQRLFTAMLSRLEREDTDFGQLRLPRAELVGLKGRQLSQRDYQALQEMCASLARRSVHVERPRPEKSQPGSLPDFDKLPLLAYARYCSAERVVLAQFNKAMAPHLLQQRANFTQAPYRQILKLKQPTANRIYWLLRQVAAFGERTLPLPELKAKLGLSDKYAQLAHFRLRVLEPARLALAETDLPFTYQLRAVRGQAPQMCFRFTVTEPVGEERDESRPLPSAPAGG